MTAAARIVRVARADDPAVEPYARVRERDLSRSRALFIAEGSVVVRVLVLRSGYRVRSMLLEERRVDALADVVDALDEDVPVYVAPQAVLDEVAGFPIHRGVLALGDRGPPRSPADVLARGDLVVGLVGLTNHDNVGGVFRNAAAFGASGVLLDAETCDPLYRKAIRVSVGGALVVPFARCADAGAMLDALAAGGFESIALTPAGDEPLDVLRAGRGKRALLVGAEGEGLPSSVLARARRVRIDMGSRMDSLNAAVASALALHEATRPTDPQPTTT